MLFRSQTPQSLEIINSILEQYSTSNLTGLELYDKMEHVFKTLYEEYCRDAIRPDCWLPSPDFVRHHASLGVAAGVLYPATLSGRDRTAGPQSSESEI